MPYHSARRVLGADFNFCGYDPSGDKAHVVAHLYGPGYRGPEYPAHLIPPRFSGKSQSSPRYGSPSIHQIPWLPANFVPRPPPFYFGRPQGPYLPAPLYFDPDVVAALVPRPRRHGIHNDGEEAHEAVSEIKDGVWLIIIYYKPCMGSESNIKEFSITTEMPWEEFQRISSTYLGGGVTQLCCMTRGESGRGSLVALREGHDWVNLMANVRKCCRSGDYKELRVMNRQVELGANPSYDQRQIRLLQLDQYPGLIAQSLDLERHPFEYPTIQDLLLELDVSGRGDPEYSPYLETLHRSRMIHVDELTMISERDLFVASGIPPGKIHAIFVEARRMMLGVHKENEEIILEMTEMRRERREKTRN